MKEMRRVLKTQFQVSILDNLELSEKEINNAITQTLKQKVDFYFTSENDKQVKITYSVIKQEDDIAEFDFFFVFSENK
jgi:uncharacterized membrane protein